MEDIKMFDIKTIEIIKKIANDYPNRLKDVLNSLSERQQVSKEWLVEKLNEYKHPYRNKLKGGDLTITILCCWYGMLAYKLIEKFNRKIFRIHCVDYDPRSKRINTRLFRKIDNENLNKGILTHIKFWERDIKDLPEKEYYKSDIVINTSCEHLHQQTIYDTIDKLERGTLVVLQSNNYKEINEHVNCSDSLEDFANLYVSKLRNMKIYQKDFIKYKRFMIIGTKI